MEGTTANIKEITCTERINENVDIGLIKDKEMVIEEFEQAQNFIKGVEIKNEEDLVNCPLFNNTFPTEIKKYILSHLCDSNTFVATSVCQEWKKILESGFKDKEVIIGKECSKCEDEDNECAKPTDMFKAAAVHKLDVHLIICTSVTEVESKCIVDALTSVHKFTISSHYEFDNMVILSDNQFEQLFMNIEMGDKVTEEVNLVRLDLNDINQERLANCLVNKSKKVTLDQLETMGPMLDVKTFLTKIQDNSANLKLTHLTLHNFDLHQVDGFSYSNAADALCNVENVKLTGWSGFMMGNQIMERLVENILQRPIPMKTLIVDSKDLYLYLDVFYDFGSLISPQDLTTLFSKMTVLQLEGGFTLNQLEAVGALPDVEIKPMQTRNNREFFHLVKGSSGMF